MATEWQIHLIGQHIAEVNPRTGPKTKGLKCHNTPAYKTVEPIIYPEEPSIRPSTAKVRVPNEREESNGLQAN